MKRILILLLLTYGHVYAQNEEQNNRMEDQLEQLSETSEENLDEDFLLQMEQYRRNQLNLNAAYAEDLQELNILTPLQIQQLLQYRNLLGNLLHIYELQAVPGWDLATIRRILPFVMVADTKNMFESLKERITGGDHIIRINISNTLETAKGYAVQDADKSSYPGSKLRLLTRYNYRYKNNLQWGLLGDKDAGEQFLKGAQKTGFDFYSFHFFAKRVGAIKQLALGDFTVSLGQGLIHWQSMGFKKSTLITNVKRQSAVLRPYTSAGEFNFHRGMGITIEKKKWESTIFVSYRKLSASTEEDTTVYKAHITSIITSGYHRTASEAAKKNNVTQLAFGGNLQYNTSKFHLGLNAIQHRFSLPIQKRDLPYNIYSINGTQWLNASADYSYTWHNLHLFGELAIDQQLHKAWVQGCLLSLHNNLDASLVVRLIDPEYQAINANAFTENSAPSNERGVYAGISLRPVHMVRIDVYADVFVFPWLKYRVDGPSAGKEFVAQFTYTPNKRVEYYMRYKADAKQGNETAVDAVMHPLIVIPRQSIRLHGSIQVSRQLALRHRVELNWYDREGAAAAEGYLIYADAVFKPERKPWNLNVRLQHFETGGYNARVYAFENSGGGGFSVPGYFDNGARWYLNLRLKAGQWLYQQWRKKADLDLWLRCAQTIYTGKSLISSGLDEIAGNKKTDYSLQLVLGL